MQYNRQTILLGHIQFSVGKLCNIVGQMQYSKQCN